MDRLQRAVSWCRTAPLEDLGDVDAVAHAIGSAGLFFDSRHSPDDPTRSLYGDDVRYMMPDDDGSGTWQTPRQLAAYLVYLKDREIKTYADVGTFSGWTITLVAAYLMRFGLERVVAVDVNDHLYPGIADLWAREHLPIEYHVVPPEMVYGIVEGPYDVLFIDANHDYECVRRDYDTLKDRARIVVLHDVHDAWCTGVVRLWNEITASGATIGSTREFIEHPNGFRLMGIGVVEKKSAV